MARTPHRQGISRRPKGAIPRCGSRSPRRGRRDRSVRPLRAAVCSRNASAPPLPAERNRHRTARASGRSSFGGRRIGTNVERTEDQSVDELEHLARDGAAVEREAQVVGERVPHRLRHRLFRRIPAGPARRIDLAPQQITGDIGSRLLPVPLCHPVFVPAVTRHVALQMRAHPFPAVALDKEFQKGHPFAGGRIRQAQAAPLQADLPYVPERHRRLILTAKRSTALPVCSVSAAGSASSSQTASSNRRTASGCRFWAAAGRGAAKQKKTEKQVSWQYFLSAFVGGRPPTGFLLQI